MKILKITAVFIISLSILPILFACSAASLPFKASDVSDMKLVSLPDNVETALTAEECKSVAEALLKAMLIDKPKNADPPTPEYYLIFGTTGTDKDEYKLAYAGKAADALAFKEDNGNIRYWVRGDELNAVIAAIIEKRAG